MGRFTRTLALALMAFATCSSFAAERAKLAPLKEGAYGLQTTRPAGDYKVYNRSGYVIMDNWEGLGKMEQDDYLGEMVFAEDGVVWVRNLITFINNNVWIAGHLSEDGSKILIDCGTPLSYDQWSQQYIYLYPAVVESESLASASYYSVAKDESVDVISFSVSGDRIVLDGSSDDFHGLAPFYEDGSWGSYMDSQTSFADSGLSAPEPPAGMEVAKYQLIGRNPDYTEFDLDDRIGGFVYVGRSGEDVYVQGASTMDTELWMKGSYSNGVVTFPNHQFMGVTSGYPLYLNAAKAESIVDPDWGYSYINYTLVEQAITFDMAEDGSMTNPSADMLFTMYSDNSDVYFGSRLEPTITPAYSGAAMPKTPVITSVDCWEDWDGESYYGIAIRTSQIDVDGNLLDASKMYYSVDIDGESFTFTPDIYTTLDEPITEVPMDWTDYDYFWTMDSYQSFYIFQEKLESVAVRVIYYGGDERTVTPDAVYTVTDMLDVFKEGTVWECRALGEDVLLLEDYSVPVTYELKAPVEVDWCEYYPLEERRENASEVLFGVRNDAGKIYAISLSNSAIGERLIYDFTLQPGESCEIYDAMSINREDVSPIIIECESVEDFENSGVSHQYMYLKGYYAMDESDNTQSGFDIKWLRGIGSAYAGVLWNMYEQWDGGGMALDRVVCDGEVVYESENSGVNTISDRDSTSTTAYVLYYTLDGRRISTPNTAGVYIKRTISTNGKITNEKIVRK